MRLNKYISNAGICSRRKADEHIKAGEVKVNGVAVYEMGYKVQPNDEVRFKGRLVTPAEKIYILLNKPKDTISTTEDTHGRRTVMDCVASAKGDGLFPVGRLDRNTTGLLLITNDGELAQKLTHPSFRVQKLYQVVTDKPVQESDLTRLFQGVKLEEGIAKVDEVNYVQGKDRNYVGVKIHMGWNRVVRRMFAELGYKVKQLDRVLFANLTKKDLPRSKWRYLKPKEIISLKHFKVG